MRGLFIIAFGCVWSALAQTPIATVSSGESFEVDGVKVPVAGLPSWPLMAGDVISTGEGPAVISLGDQGRLVLSKNSKLQLQSGPGQPSVRNGILLPATIAAGSITLTAILLRGAVSVRPESGSGLRVKALDRVISPPAGAELAVAVNGNNVLTGPDTSSLEPQIAGTKTTAVRSAGKPKPSPTPTPTPPPPPSPK